MAAFPTLRRWLAQGEHDVLSLAEGWAITPGPATAAGGSSLLARGWTAIRPRAVDPGPRQLEGLAGALPGIGRSAPPASISAPPTPAVFDPRWQPMQRGRWRGLTASPGLRSGKLAGFWQLSDSLNRPAAAPGFTRALIGPAAHRSARPPTTATAALQGHCGCLRCRRSRCLPVKRRHETLPFQVIGGWRVLDCRLAGCCYRIKPQMWGCWAGGGSSRAQAGSRRSDHRHDRAGAGRGAGDHGGGRRRADTLEHIYAHSGWFSSSISALVLPVIPAVGQANRCGWVEAGELATFLPRRQTAGSWRGPC